MKTCSECGEIKSESEFYLRESGRLRNNCKKCVSNRACNWAVENPEKHRENSRRGSRTYYWKDPEASRAYHAKQRADNPENHRKAARKHRENRPEEAKRIDSVRYWKDPEAENARRGRHARAQYKNDPAFKVKCNLRSRLGMALKGLGAKKSGPTFDLLGCSVEEWMQHLESQFRPGMTWENYGPVWHVDHIKPCAAFNLLDPEQQRLCFSWTNTQPLFAEENLRKSDHYAPPEPQTRLVI